MNDFTTIRAVGSALPSDVLGAVIGSDGLKGLTTDDYRLEIGLSPREAANRAWAVLTGAYSGFRDAVDKLPDTDKAVGLTRDKWLMILLRELGFGRVPTTPAGGLSADDRQFPVSHQYVTDAGDVPVHLLGWGVELDKKTAGTPGAADRAPHAMVQEFLNRNDQALWGILSNGRKLRLLRDSSTLIGQSFVEFDLEAMFDGEVFSDFVVLFLVCHATRFDTKNLDTPDTDPTPADCWLERWRTHAAETGTRALEALSPAVRAAIEELGSGFARFPTNDVHPRLATGDLTAHALHLSLLRLVYRLLFCFVAEDRGLLLDPAAAPVARQRYIDWYSTARLRRIATRRRGTGHADLFHGVGLVLEALGTEHGRPELALVGLGGVFDSAPDDPLREQDVSNAALLAAIRNLTVFQPKAGGPLRRVDYRNLGTEELGSVYESLLDYEPGYDPTTRTFTLSESPASARSASGAFYTPASIIDAILEETLDPLLDDAEQSSDPEAALLSVTVCDPACGSGHFLVAAARRIAARLADVRERHHVYTPGLDPSRHALHQVVQRCVFGVDINPMAAELARVSLFLEGVEPGKPLGFLDAHIKVGNALLGTTPALINSGIPNDAFKRLADDDAVAARSWSNRNRQERSGQGRLFGSSGLPVSNTQVLTQLAALPQLPVDDLATVRAIAEQYQAITTGHAAERQRLIADAWCSAFLTAKVTGAPPITQATLDGFAGGAAAGTDDVSVLAVVDRVRTVHQPFHWHIAFPEIFVVPDGGAPTDTGWTGGFSCVVGNPPFLSPLVASGARLSPARNLTRTVLHGLGGPKADESSCFLLLADQIAAPFGRIGLVLPDSFLSASDSADIRRWIGTRHDLAAIWRGDGTEFAASVTTIFVSLAPRGSVSQVRRYTGPEFVPLSGGDLPWRDSSWAPLVSTTVESASVLEIESALRLADLCEITADYRDQYYGLVGAVYDDIDDSNSCDDPPLITTGLIEPLVSLWGTTSTKFNKVTYARPRVRLTELSPNLQKWAKSRLRPKLLIATQGRMLEVVVDQEGAWLPCVPVLSVFESRESGVGLDSIAAIMLSPATFEYLRLTKLGSGLGSEAIKVSASDLRALPAPADMEIVRRASALVGGLTDPGTRAAFRQLMNDAYGVGGDVGDEWEKTITRYFERRAA